MSFLLSTVLLVASTCVGNCGRPVDYCEGFTEAKFEGCGAGETSLVDPSSFLLLVEPGVGRSDLDTLLPSLPGLANRAFEFLEPKTRRDDGKGWVEVRLGNTEPGGPDGPAIAHCLRLMSADQEGTSWAMDGAECGWLFEEVELSTRLKLSRLVSRALPVAAAMPIEVPEIGVAPAWDSIVDSLRMYYWAPDAALVTSTRSHWWFQDIGIGPVPGSWEGKANIAVVDIGSIENTEGCPLDELLPGDPERKPGHPSNHATRIACYSLKRMLVEAEATATTQLESVSFGNQDDSLCVTSATMAQALTELKAPVASISLRLWGPDCMWQPVHDAIQNRPDVAFVFPSSNCSGRIRDCPEEQAAARFGLPNAVTVGGYSQQRRLRYLYGTDIDLAAPTDLLYGPGTSFSAPLVAAATAILVARFGLDPQAALSCLQNNVQTKVDIECDCSSGQCSDANSGCLRTGGTLFMKRLIDGTATCP